MKDINWYKERHKMMWDEIIAELTDPDSYFFRNDDDVEALNELELYVWGKISKHEEDMPTYVCYAYHYMISARKTTKKNNEDECINCPIAKSCGRCTDDDSVYHKLSKLIENIIDPDNTEDIEKAISYCKAIRDSW